MQASCQTPSPALARNGSGGVSCRYPRQGDAFLPASERAGNRVQIIGTRWFYDCMGELAQIRSAIWLVRDPRALLTERGLGTSAPRRVF
jgi:hypothetical protein